MCPNKNDSPAKILIVDDHPAVREALAQRHRDGLGIEPRIAPLAERLERNECRAEVGTDAVHHERLAGNVDRMGYTGRVFENLLHPIHDCDRSVLRR